MKLYPSVRWVTEATPASRDRALDVLRIFSLFVVVSGHGLMALLVLDGTSLQLDNVLAESKMLQVLTWGLQVLPLFFFAGAGSSALGYKRGESDWGSWLLRRAQRLYRPVFFYLAFWVVALLVLHATVPAGIYEPIAGLSVQLLWFLGVYVLVLGCVPLLARIQTGRQLAITVGSLYVGVLLVDVVRMNGGPTTLGFVNFLLAWLIPAALGVGYVRHVVATRVAWVLAGLALIIDIALISIGPYELSLVTIPGQNLSNMTPPSLLLAGHSIVLCSVAIAIAPILNRLAHQARLWWVMAIGNSGAMTLYLWHLPALLFVHWVSHLIGRDRSSITQPDYWWLVLAQMVAFYLVTAILFTLLYRAENLPLPWWDRRPAGLRGLRSAAVGVLVLVAGGCNLLAAKWGLSGPGVPIMAMMLAALALARLLAGSPRTD